jgi:uncharacterized protein (DUF2252 family)
MIQAPLSPFERMVRGKAARVSVPRQSQSAWTPSSQRCDPVELLEQQAKTRAAELVPIRYGRMLVSPFAFLRGAALIMAADLATTPSSGFQTQLCGDAHLSNFGIFGTPERRLVFDLNDFDETSPGPWEWDVKRLATSIAVVGRDRGFSRKERTEMVVAAVHMYRTTMRSFAVMSNLNVWHAHLDVDQLLEQHRADLDRRTLKRVTVNLASARTHDSVRAVAKLTEIVNGERRIIHDPPLIVPIEELVHGVEYDHLHSWLRLAFQDYLERLRTDHCRLLEQYRLVHFARKVVGVGSVGTRAWIALFVGRDSNDPLFLQMKEAQQSVLEPFTGPSEYDNHAQRVVVGERLMQAASDMFLGWDRIEDMAKVARDFYVRQLQDWKASVNLARATYQGMIRYGRMCGWTLARAHARCGDRIAIAAYLGSSAAFDRAMAAFAEAYADQNQRDYLALVDAVKTGRVQATPGV